MDVFKYIDTKPDVCEVSKLIDNKSYNFSEDEKFILRKYILDSDFIKMGSFFIIRTKNCIIDLNSMMITVNDVEYLFENYSSYLQLVNDIITDDFNITQKDIEYIKFAYRYYKSFYVC